MCGRQYTGSVRLLGVLAGAVVLLDGTAAWAARRLEIRVERNGQTVLTGAADDDGRTDTDPGDVWNRLVTASLRLVGEVRADPADPLRAKLVGRIRVVVLHGDRPAAEDGPVRTDVTFDDLRLVRRSADSDLWRMPPEEVERTARVGQIDLPPSRGPLAIAAAGAVMFVVVAGVLWFALRGRRSRRGGPAGPPDRGLV